MALENEKSLAKKIASEKKEAQAICLKADGTLFTVDAAGAIQNNLRILEIFSGFEAGA
jgi:hypothetical protein